MQRVLTLVDDFLFQIVSVQQICNCAARYPGQGYSVHLTGIAFGCSKCSLTGIRAGLA